MVTEGFKLWLEFEVWQPSLSDDPEDDCFNMMITLDTGEQYALNVWTYKFFERERQADHSEGANLYGKYLLPPDLFVQRLDRPLMEEVVADLIATGRLKADWLVKDEAEVDDAAMGDAEGQDRIFAAFVENARREGRLAPPDKSMLMDNQAQP